MSTKTLTFNIYYGDQLVDTKTLSKDVIKIGKLKSSHLCLEDESVARMHAVIEVSGDDVRVIDLGSSTGTTLNGQRIDKNAEIGDGDTLTFGPYRLEVQDYEFLFFSGLLEQRFVPVVPDQSFTRVSSS